MSTPSSPRHPEWQPARIPKLSYRKTIPQDELETFQSEQREPAPNQTYIQRSDSSYTAATRTVLPSASLMPSKKKNSFFGGLFAKEPTLLALAQVEADLKAKHGAATPQKVPHVSSRKMPEHVPKVNTRWDGIPEVLKQREREDKQRRRTSQRNSMFPPTGAYYGNNVEMEDGDMNGPRRPSDTPSNSDMWHSQEGTVFGRSTVVAGHSISSGESRRSSIRETPSYQSHSLRSPSDTSLPEITSFFPHHEKTAPSQAGDRWQNRKSAHMQQKYSDYQSPSDISSSGGFNSSFGETPEPSVSARTDPRENFQASRFDDAGIQVAYDSEKQVAHDTEKQVVPDSGKQTAGVRNFSKPDLKRGSQGNKIVAMDAFLAGEARPLQLDDDDEDEDDEDNDDEAEDGAGEEEKTRPSDLPLRQYIHTQPLATRSKAHASIGSDAVRRRHGLVVSKSTVRDVVPWEASELPNTSRVIPTPSKSNQSRGTRRSKKVISYK